MKQSRRKVCSVLLSIGIIASSFAIPSYAAESKNFTPKISAIDSYENPSYAIGELSEKSGESPEKIVEKNYNKKLNGSGNSEQKSYKQISKSKNSFGRTVISTVQTFNGFPVYGADQNFHINDAGVIECIAGSNVNDIENQVVSKSFSAKYSQKDVLNAVEKHLGFTPKYETAPEPEIILYPVSGKYHYVYQVEVEAFSPCYISCTYYIDAGDLSVITVNNHIRSIDGDVPVVGQGKGQSGETKNNLNMVRNNNGGQTYTYYLRNTVDKFDTCEGFNGGAPTPLPGVTDPFGPTTLTFGSSFYDDDANFNYEVTNTDSVANVVYQKAAVDAHYNVTNVIKFFKNAPFYRNAQEDNDKEDTEMKVAIITNNPENDPTLPPVTEPMAWGNLNYLGFHITSSNSNKIVSHCVDVVAHEYSHGILRAEGLTGINRETLTLSEGIGDVFGVLAEYYIDNEGSTDDWIMGEDILEVGESWRRDCANPEIDDYNDYDAKPNAPLYKAGGVITKAAALMALGGTHNTVSVNAIGYNKLARIFYSVIDNKFTPENVSLKQFANFAVEAARLLYGDGSEAYNSTRDAFISVYLIGKPPADFKCSKVDGLAVTLAWNAPAGSNIGIYKKQAGTKDEPVSIYTTTSTTGWTFNTFYGSVEYYVAYVDDSDKMISGYSNAVPVEKLTKSAPTDLNKSYIDSSNVLLSWNGTTGETFAVYRKISGTNDIFEKVGETNNKQMTVSILPGKYDYKVAVVGLYGARLSPFTNVLTIESYLPAPTNFIRLETPTNTTAATFTWDNAGATRFAIYRFIPSSNTAEKVDETQHNFGKVNIITGTNFYMVAIVDTDGNRISKFSNLKSV